MAGRSRLADRITEQRLTYKKLAKLVGVSVSAVYRWVHGINEPRHYQRHALAEALDVPLDQLDWYLACDDQPAAVPALSVGPQVPSVAGSVSAVDRREMLTGLGGTFAVGTAFNFTGLFQEPRDVSPDLAGYFFDQLAEHNKANQQIGARPLLPTVVSQYALIGQAVDVAGPGQRTDLLRAQVAYAGFVGWLHQDSGDRADALHWHNQSLTLARQLGDPNHLAYTLGGLAFLYTDRGDNHAGIETADLALSIPGVHGPTRVSILGNVTRTYAQAGAHDALEGALNEGADLGDRYGWRSTSPFGGSTAFAMSSAYVNARRATCHLRNGHYAEAAQLLESGNTAYRPGVHRERGMWHTRHAHALLKAEGPQAALQPTLDAVDCLNRAPSARVRRELTHLRTHIPTNTSAGHELREVLETL